jgi:hypothetical protein
MRKLNTEEFINRAIKVHGELYDYGKSKYLNTRSDIVITCLIHGDFKQKAELHLRRQGCTKCSGKYRHSTKEIVNKLIETQNKRYDYSLVEYISSNVKINIICKRHGIFKQLPKDHKKGSGCPHCFNEQRSIKQIKLKPDLRRLSNLIRDNINKSYKSKGFSKKTKTFRVLGCSWKQFKSHLENNKYEFKIIDSNLDLDHIIPISSAKTEEELIKLNHYSNFQLLPSYYNRYIKKDNIFDRIDFEKYIRYECNK